MKKRICLIGNNAFDKPVFDGQRIKVRTYKQCLESEGFEVFFVELDRPLRRFFSILRRIKKGIRECDVIVLITSDNGEKVLIPYINRVNKKYHKRFVFSQIGTSFLYKYIKSMSEERKNAFFYSHDFNGLKPDKKTKRELLKVDAILTETELINSAFKSFFGLNNCFFLTNFRNVTSTNILHFSNSCSKLIYLSRITARKGIFDLLDVLSKEPFKGIKLDIYGSLYMKKDEKNKFYSYLNSDIKYKGELCPQKTIETIGRYDLLCFPTKCEGEGTPGCIVESLIAGVPVLSSNFTQSSELLKKDFDSIIYNFGDVKDLEHKLLDFVNHKIDSTALKKNALDSGARFTYSFNRDSFLIFVTGEKVK